MIIPGFIPMLERCFAIPGFVGRRALVFGFQDFDIHEIFTQRIVDLSWKRRLLKLGYIVFRRLLEIPVDYRVSDLGQLLTRKGFETIDTIDLFDRRANIIFDMNHAVPDTWHERYDAVIDIGSVEHLFDARRAFENCLRMTAVGGFYVLSTPIKGFFGHGLHTFNPEGLVQMLQLNGCELFFKGYTRRGDGREIREHRDASDVSIWLTARKIRHMTGFAVPQQGFWPSFYATRSEERAEVMASYKRGL